VHLVGIYILKWRQTDSSLHVCMLRTEYRQLRTDTGSGSLSLSFDIIILPFYNSVPINFMYCIVLISQLFQRSLARWTCLHLLDLSSFVGHVFICWTCLHLLDMSSFVGLVFICWICLNLLDMSSFVGLVFICWICLNLF